MNTPQEKFLKDYQPPTHFIHNVCLEFELHETSTIVRSQLKVSKNKTILSKSIILDGEEIELLSIKLNDENLDSNDYSLNENNIEIFCSDDSFTLEIETKINPKSNTKLEGLYLSNNIYCTQCEATGFRRITYFLDRPDVMSTYKTTVIGPSNLTYLLSNGNCIESQKLENGKHRSIWLDPFPKPCYLFALVAGDLSKSSDTYTTMSGKQVDLEVFVEPKDKNKCTFALEALKKSMKWDEDVFKRGYDLNAYMIVAVSHFNMGAMENKGLNIFNSKYVLATNETATDTDYDNIESVIAHEYFHNWTGNRITLRDWFQLSLKEGLTIYRDQEFSCDMGSRDIKRIDDINILKNHQFKEDSSPLAHPVRPHSYIEMNNFYTVTVYNKGAELIRMLKILIGGDNFKKAMDLYFEKFDAKAITTDDFVETMEIVSKKDLSQFKRWYSQAGTPIVDIKHSYDKQSNVWTLSLSQNYNSPIDTIKNLPFHIPIYFQLINNDKIGKTIESHFSKHIRSNYLIELTKKSETFIIPNISEPPKPVFLSEFSAPIKISVNKTEQENLKALNEKNIDGYSKWEICQEEFQKEIISQEEKLDKSKTDTPTSPFFNSLKSLLSNDIDPALLSLLISPPSLSYLMEQRQNIDIEQLYQAKKNMLVSFISENENILKEIYFKLQTPQYQYSAKESGKRRLKNLCLHYLNYLEKEEYTDLAVKQYQNSDNMTDTFSSLSAIANTIDEKRDHYYQDFYHRYQSDPLVIDKWFSLQAGADHKFIYDELDKLKRHSFFDIKNPNRVRSVLVSFSFRNLRWFHHKSGRGYNWALSLINQLDEVNPQVSARMIQAFSSWKKLNQSSRKIIQDSIKILMSKKDLSKDAKEIIGKIFN